MIIPIGPSLPDDSSVSEIQNIELWSSMNRMKLNLTKTWELVMRGKTQKKKKKTPPETVHMIERKSELKLLILSTWYRYWLIPFYDL